MPSQSEIQKVRSAIGYPSLSESRIIEALTAAGAEKENNDGNKRLSQMGTSLVEYHVIEMGYRTMMSRGTVDLIRSTLTTANYRALIAKRHNIDQFIKYAPSGSQAASVLAQAVSALIAVLNLEAKDPDITREGILRLGFLSIEDNADHAELLNQYKALFLPQTPAQSLPPTIGHFDDTFLDPNGPLEFLSMASLPYMSKGHSVCAAQTIIDDLLEVSTGYGNENTSLSHMKRALDDLELIEEPSSKRQDIGDSCRGFFLRDTEKCRAQGLAPPRETFFSAHIESRMLELNCKFLDAFCTILAQIASSSSVVALKEALECSRSSLQIQSWKISEHATPFERIAIIGELGAREMFCALLKRYHIMELFRNCGGSDTRSTTKMVICTGRETFQESGRAGNPCHNDEAYITDKVMKEAFPNFQPGCKDYDSKRRSMSRLRVLGRRLQLFTERFGNSCLAFMQPCRVPGDCEKSISDHMILAPSETDFKLFLDILDESQGSMLRQFSTAADKIVRHLIYEGMDHPEPFHLEMVDSKTILEYPKGSPDLLLLMK